MGESHTSYTHITNHHGQSDLEQDGRNRTAETRRPTASATTAPCASHKQRRQTRNDVRDNRQRSRVQKVRRLYHRRPADIINRSATTVMTTTTSTTNSASATIPPVHDIQHDQSHAVDEQLDDSALILHSVNTSTDAPDRQAGCDPHPHRRSTATHRS